MVQIINPSFAGAQKGGNTTEDGVLAGSGGNVTVANSNFENLTFGVQTSGGVLVVASSSFVTGVGIMTASGTTANATNNTFTLGTVCTGAGTFNTAGDNKVGGGASTGCTTSTMTKE